MQSHSHTITSSTAFAFGGSGSTGAGGGSSNLINLATTNTVAQGGGNAQNLQPYAVFTYLVRVLVVKPTH